ncbi:MAG: hypothetical protein N2Z70_02115 [Bdellovibrionaceae bacterium]|jgi:hypothetical protein|nr:hypothetical protein [Pseudobdellovibrionaceae bacterium]
MSKKHPVFVIWLFIVLALIGLISSVTLLIEPKLVYKIKWSDVASAQTVSDSLWHVLRPLTANLDVLVIGLAEPEDFKGNPWLRALLKGWPYKKNTIWVHNELVTWAGSEDTAKSQLSTDAITVFPREKGAALALNLMSDEQSLPTLVLAPIAEAAFFVSDSLGYQLGKGLKTLHLLVGRTPGPEDLQRWPCQPAASLQSPLRLGCEVIKLSQVHRKKIDKTQAWGFLLTQMGERDYLLLWKKGPLAQPVE